MKWHLHNIDIIGHSENIRCGRGSGPLCGCGHTHHSHLVIQLSFLFEL